MLNGFSTGFTGTNANCFAKLGNEYFPITDFSRAGGVDDCLDDLIRNVVGDGELDLRFRKKIDDILCATIEFGMPALPSETLYFSDCDSDRKSVV